MAEEFNDACTLSKKSVRGSTPPPTPAPAAAAAAAALDLMPFATQRLIGFGVCFAIGVVLSAIVRGRLQPGGRPLPVWVPRSRRSSSSSP